MSSALRIVVVIVFLLLLLIPLGMIDSILGERIRRFEETSYNLVQESGGQLEMMGPLVVVPFEETIPAESVGKLPTIRQSEMVFLPETANLESHLNVEYRSRGIYRVPVFSAEIHVEGTFIMPSASAFPEGARLLTDKMYVTTGFRDMRGIRSLSDLQWNDSEFRFKPYIGFEGLDSGIQAFVPSLTPGESTAFSWNMEVDGGGSVGFTPLGRDSALSISGNWPSPSFGGAMLPETREWDESGFRGEWRVPEVSRPIRASWDSGAAASGMLEGHALRVELLEPVNAYARSERSIKYGALFLLIPFAVFFLFEILGGIRVHPVQYLLAGIADAIFYLLLLALSEHFGFDLAYGIAASAVTLLLTFYVGTVVRKGPGRWMMLPVMAAAYIWLWFTLKSEDYALLIGTSGIFVLIAAVMILTRNVNWYGDEGSRKQIEQAPDS